MGGVLFKGGFHPMKNTILQIMLAVSLASPCGLRAQDAAPTPAQHRETYHAEVRKLDARFAARLKELEKELSTAVHELETRFVKEGNLAGVVAARGVLDALEDPFVEVAAPEQGAPAALRRAVEEHQKQTRALDAEEVRARGNLKAKYIEYLERVKQRLTTERKIDEALAIHKEIERLNEEVKRAPATPADPDVAVEAAPSREPEKSAPNPGARALLSEAELIERLKTLSGTPVAFHGRIKSIENDGMSRTSFYINLDGGVKFRLPLPNNSQLAKRGNTSVLRSRNTDILLPGARVAIQANIARGTIHHAMPNTFLDTVLIGSDSALARRSFQALCHAPCQPLSNSHPLARSCPVCGIGRVD